MKFYFINKPLLRLLGTEYKCCTISCVNVCWFYLNILLILKNIALYFFSSHFQINSISIEGVTRGVESKSTWIKWNELLWNKETACEDHLKATNSLAKMRSRGLRVAFSETARQTTEWNCISGKQNWKPKFRRVRPQIPEAAAFSSHCWLLQQLTASYQQLQWQHGNLIRDHKLEAEELLCGNSLVKLAVLLSGHTSSWWKLRLWSLMQDNGNYSRRTL